MTAQQTFALVREALLSDGYAIEEDHGALTFVAWRKRFGPHTVIVYYKNPSRFRTLSAHLDFNGPGDGRGDSVTIDSNDVENIIASVRILTDAWRLR